jgi:hypothetical protein
LREGGLAYDGRFDRRKSSPADETGVIVAAFAVDPRRKQGVNKPAVVVVVSVVLWGLLWIRPFWVIPAGLGAAVCLAGLVIAGAVRSRAPGRYSGLLFAVLLLTLPVWVSALMRLYVER